jgi:phosphoenolpyruvate carboxylase
MARYSETETMTVQAILDYSASLKQVTETLDLLAESMKKNDLEAIQTRNFKTGDDGYQMILKYAAAMQEGFGVTLTNRSIGEVRAKSAEKTKVDATLDQAKQALKSVKRKVR